MNIDDLPGHEISDVLAYSGLVLLAFELLKRMIVKPIVDFYVDITFGEGPFKSYEEDVAVRHKNQFEAVMSRLKIFAHRADNV